MGKKYKMKKVAAATGIQTGAAGAKLDQYEWNKKTAEQHQKWINDMQQEKENEVIKRCSFKPQINTRGDYERSTTPLDEG